MYVGYDVAVDCGIIERGTLKGFELAFIFPPEGRLFLCLIYHTCFWLTAFTIVFCLMRAKKAIKNSYTLNFQQRDKIIIDFMPRLIQMNLF